MATPTADTDIVNLALDLLAHEAPIESMDDPRKASLIATRWYDATRRRVLRMYPWNFAKKLATLYVDATETPAHTYGLAYALPDDFVRLMFLSSGDEGILLGRQFFDVVGTHIYMRLGAPQSTGSVENLAATITPGETTGEDIDFTLSVGLLEDRHAGGEIANDVGTGKGRITSISSPTEVKVTITEDFPDTDPIAAGDWSLTSYDALNVTYVYDVDDVDDFDAMFVDLLVTELAVKLSYKLTQKVSVRAALEKLRADIRTDAASISGQEAPPMRVESNPLTRNRRNMRRGRDQGGIYYNF